MEKEKIIIIGGGLSGLAAGIYAQKYGYESVILEKNNRAGGLCTTWYKNGAIIDGCMHWITGSGNDSIRKLYNELGMFENKTILKLPYFLKFYYEDKTLTIWRDLKKFKEEMLNHALEEDRKEVLTFIKFIKAMQGFPVFFGHPFDTMTKSQFVKAAGRIAPYAMVYLKLNKITIGDYASRFKTPILNHFLRSFIPDRYALVYLVGVIAKFVSSNADIIPESSGELALSLVNKYETLGGKIVYNANINKLEFENGRVCKVCDDKGNSYVGDRYVSAMPLPYLYNNLLPNEYHDIYTDKILNDDMIPIISALYISFKVDGNYTELPHYFTINKPDGFLCQSSINDGLSFRSYPYMKNKDGSTTLICLVDQFQNDYEMWKKSKENGEYEILKTKYANQVLDLLEETFNGIKEHIELVDIATPLTFERYTNAHKGAYLSHLALDNGPRQTFKRKAKGLSNLYYAGIWVDSIGGIPVSVANGVYSIMMIKKDIENEMKLRK